MADLEKPGCFGFVVCYEPDSEFCAGCAHSQACAGIVAARRTALEKLLAGGVAGAPKGPPKRADAHVKRVAVIAPVASPVESPEITMEETELKPKRGGSAPKRYDAGEMSKKARQLDESLKRLEIDAVAKLKAGHNPMDGVDRLTFFKLACELLLADGYLDREKLRKAYTEKLGWDIKTASSHLSIIASYMVAQGILAVDGKSLLRVAR
jgi:hypothetical protein